MQRSIVFHVIVIWATCATAGTVDWVEIPTGSFIMGCPASDEAACWPWNVPRHQVSLSSFRVAVYPVTTSEFVRFLNASGFPPEDALLPYRDPFATFLGVPSSSEGILGRDRFHVGLDGATVTPGCERWPMLGVTWEGASAYCDWLSTATERYRLPTEAEWEYLATSGGATRYPWGDQEVPPIDPDWEGGRTIYDLFLGDMPVGSLEANANRWGVRDLLLTVKQWCLDYYEPDFYATSPSQDPVASDRDAASRDSTGVPERVLRGGYMTAARPARGFHPLGGSVSILGRGYTRDHFGETAEVRTYQWSFGFRWVLEITGNSASLESRASR